VELLNEPRWNLLIKNEGKPDVIIKSNESQWFADPFLFEQDGKTFVFVEVMQKWRAKGAIGYFDLSAQKPRCKIVIDERFHMSFPNVFQNSTGIYMIPETFQDHKISVYSATHFPNQWVKSKTLIDNVYYVDTALIKLNDGSFEIVTYDISSKPATLRVFVFDIEKLVIGKQLQYMVDESDELRPAGNSFVSDGKIVLPTQGHSNGAECVLLKYEINESGFVVKSHSPQVIESVDGYLACHTFNHSERSVVFDELTKPFDLFRPLSGIISRLVWKKRTAVLVKDNRTDCKE
jgi:hypothetical protein